MCIKIMATQCIKTRNIFYAYYSIFLRQLFFHVVFIWFLDEAGWIGGSQKMKSYQRRQAWFLCNWFFYFYASWANRVSKNSFRRLLYIVGAHFIYCWITIIYIVGAHLYLMLEHISMYCINSYPCILERLIYIIGWHFCCYKFLYNYQ